MVLPGDSTGLKKQVMPALCQTNINYHCSLWLAMERNTTINLLELWDPMPQLH